MTAILWPLKRRDNSHAIERATIPLPTIAISRCFVLTDITRFSCDFQFGDRADRAN
jgi:hypothetical protein